MGLDATCMHLPFMVFKIFSISTRLRVCHTFVSITNEIDLTNYQALHSRCGPHDVSLEDTTMR